MIDFRPDVKEIIKKYSSSDEILSQTAAHFSMFCDINNLLNEVDLKSEKEKDFLQRKFKKYVLSTMKFSSLSKMISGIAHEINTPLAIIQIRSDQLFEATKAEEFNKEAFEKSLSSIDQTAKRIGSIVVRLRNYSRSLSHEELERVSLKTVIENTAALTRDRYLTEGVTLELDPSCEDCDIECRSSDMSQLLLNVFNNSFTALKGRNEKWIKVFYRRENNFVKIEITDAGLGISNEIKSKIFTPYFTCWSDEHSLGLGLAIARDFAEAHHGSLHLDETSKNTKFILTLPVAKLDDFADLSQY